jgi:hypothetical protein
MSICITAYKSRQCTNIAFICYSENSSHSGIRYLRQESVSVYSLHHKKPCLNISIHQGSADRQTTEFIYQRTSTGSRYCQLAWPFRTMPRHKLHKGGPSSPQAPGFLAPQSELTPNKGRFWFESINMEPLDYNMLPEMVLYTLSHHIR